MKYILTDLVKGDYGGVNPPITLDNLFELDGTEYTPPTPIEPSNRNIEIPSDVVSMAHRGMFGWNNAPENSIDSAIMAVRAGFDIGEFDVQPTSDGKFIVMHDLTINRTMRMADYSAISGTVSVSSTSFADLRSNYVLTSASTYMRKPIPTLTEVLKVYRNSGVVPLIEMKTGAFTNPLIKSFYEECCEVMGVDNFILQSFNFPYLVYLRSIAPNCPIWFLSSTALSAPNKAIVLANKPSAVFQKVSSITEAGVKDLLSLGVPTYPYTAKAIDYTSLIEKGVMGYCTEEIAPSTFNKESIQNYNNESDNWSSINVDGTVSSGVLVLNTGQKATRVAGSDTLKVGGYSIIIEYEGNITLTATNLTQSYNSGGEVKRIEVRMLTKVNPTFTIEALANSKLYNLHYKLIRY